jgi:chorismate mutase
MANNTIAEMRKEFEDIDKEILKLIARRMQLSKNIAGLKRDSGIGVVQPEIWHQQMWQRKTEGKQYQVNEAFIVKLFSLIHDESVRIQKEELEAVA